MSRNNTHAVQKLAAAGVLTAVAVVGSFLSVPVAGSKCAPVQHMVNVFAAVLLGPWWGIGIAFCASLIRNLSESEAFLHFREVCVEHFLADSFINMERNSHLHISVR